MKTNKFKTPKITYDPIVQPKQPLWMHSIEKSSNGDTKDAVKSVIFILIFIVLAFTILKQIYG